jgi:hypothetical protein
MKALGKEIDVHWFDARHGFARRRSELELARRKPRRSHDGPPALLGDQSSGRRYEGGDGSESNFTSLILPPA